MRFTTKVYDQHTKQEITDGSEQAHDTYSVTKCECGAQVWFANVGTAETARCANGHRWQYNFDADRPGWINLE